MIHGGRWTEMVGLSDELQIGSSAVDLILVIEDPLSNHGLQKPIKRLSVTDAAPHAGS